MSTGGDSKRKDNDATRGLLPDPQVAMFCRFLDVNNDGMIDREEFKTLISQVSSGKFSEAELAKLFAELCDKQGSHATASVRVSSVRSKRSTWSASPSPRLPLSPPLLQSQEPYCWSHQQNWL